MTITTLKGYLEGVVWLRSRSMEAVHGGYEGYGLREGRTMYAERDLPAGVERGEAKMCFANAYRLAVLNGWTYVEGWGVAYGIPMHHAWTLDGDGKVVDPTWDFEEGREYHGVEIDLLYVSSVMVKSETFGVFYKPESYDLLKESE